MGCAVALTVSASAAEAQGYREFEQARQAYLEADYDLAVRLFEELVGTEPPALSDPTLIAESRKYLGASYVLLNRREDAGRQFRLLVQQEPDYQIPPTFPRDVVRLFSAVQEQVLEERRLDEERQRREEEERRRREIERLRRQQERLLRLQELAGQETVLVPSRRWLAAIPFGVGQFQNGHDTLGWILLVAETGLALLSLGSFILHESLRNETGDLPRDPEAALREEQFRITNWISTALLAATAIAGVVDAQVRFVPFHRETRPRELPPDLLEPVDVELGLSPFGASLRLRF